MSALQAVYREAYAHLRKRAGLRARRVNFQVDYYPYAGLSSSIFKRRHHYEVRLADLLEPSPLRVQYSLALILLAKIDARFRIERAEAAPYEAWARRPDVLKTHRQARRARGRKRALEPAGRVYDLKSMYRRLNREYFGARLDEVELGWSEGSSRTRFGHHDEDLGTIVLNRRLDSEAVPQVVVAYVLYHEMLHVQFGIGLDDEGKRVMHPPEFKREERKFPAYRTAERFLARLANAPRVRKGRRANA